MTRRKSLNLAIPQLSICIGLVESCGFNIGSSRKGVSREWNDLEGHLIPVETSVTWFDEGIPWAYFTIEEITYNMDVGTYIELSGLGQ